MTPAPFAPLSRLSRREKIASRAVTPATAAVAIASLFRFGLLFLKAAPRADTPATAAVVIASLFRFGLICLKAAPSSPRARASPPTRDHIQFELGRRPARMPMPLVISRAPSTLNKTL